MKIPVGHVLGLVAALGQVVEDETGCATVAARLHSVDAHVEVLAVGRVSVERVGDERTGRVAVLHVGRALELDDVAALAADSVRLSRPRAGAGVLVEDEAVGAGDQVGCFQVTR